MHIFLFAPSSKKCTFFIALFSVFANIVVAKKKTRLIFAKQEVVNDLKLFINVPTDENGINEFNNAFAKVQAILLQKSIDNLNIYNQSKQKIVSKLLTTLKEQVDERKINNE